MTERYQNYLTEVMRRYAIPENLIPGLVHYVGDRRPTGGFLQAVLSNDLSEAHLRAADYETEQAIGRIVRMLHHVFPATAWGSARKLDAWLVDDTAPQELYELPQTQP